MSCIFEPMTQGAVVRAVDAGALRVIETRYPAHLRLESHVHRRASLTCVLGGGFEETIRNQAFECSPHTFLFKPAGERHANRYGPAGAHCLLIEIPEPRARLAAVHGCFIRAARPKTDALVSLLLDELRADDPQAAVAIEGLALELLAAVGRGVLSESSRRRPVWFDAALEELRAHFREPVSVRALAATVAVHPTHLARAFRRFEGTAPSAYVRRLRVEWAKIQLLRSDQPLAIIAQEAGFADQSHFTRVFTQAVGRTPARFRARPGQDPEPPSTP